MAPRSRLANADSIAGLEPATPRAAAAREKRASVSSRGSSPSSARSNAGKDALGAKRGRQVERDQVAPIGAQPVTARKNPDAMADARQ